MTEFKPSISYYLDKLRADRDHIRYSREDLFKIIGITSDGFDNFIKENELHIFDSINEFTFKELVLLKKLIDKTS